MVLRVVIQQIPYRQQGQPRLAHPACVHQAATNLVLLSKHVHSIWLLHTTAASMVLACNNEMIFVM